MFIFIELVKRVSILHENFFIYKDQLTSQCFTILQWTYSHTTINICKQYSPNKQTNKQTNKQYFRILTNTKKTWQFFRILNNSLHNTYTPNTPNTPNKQPFTTPNQTHSIHTYKLTHLIHHYNNIWKHYHISLTY